MKISEVKIALKLKRRNVRDTAKENKSKSVIEIEEKDYKNTMSTFHKK